MKCADSLNPRRRHRRPFRFGCSDAVNHSPQFLVDLLGDYLKLGIADNRKHLVSVNRRDYHPTFTLIDHDVARQQQPQIRLFFERLMRKRRIANAQDQIAVEIYPQLLFQLRRLDLASLTYSFFLSVPP
jgi:hypothetical protein